MSVCLSYFSCIQCSAGTESVLSQICLVGDPPLLDEKPTDNTYLVPMLQSC